MKTSWRVNRPVESSEFVLFGVPAAYINSVFDQLTPEMLVGKKVITSIKGMIPEENKLVTDVLHERFNVPMENMAIISGPCHAEEVAMGKQSYLTIGSENEVLAKEWLICLSAGLSKYPPSEISKEWNIRR